VKNAPEENLPAMVVANLLNFTKALSGRKWTDQEISEDLSFLQEELQASFDQLTYPLISKESSFDELEHLTSIRQNSNQVTFRGHHLIAMKNSGGKMPLNSLNKIINCSRFSHDC